MKDKEITEGKHTAIIGYLTIVGSLIAITMNMEPKNAFARFHIRQAFGIHLMYHALAIVLTFTGFSFAWLPLFVIYIILWGSCFLQALKGRTKTLPLFGSYFQEWFTFIP